MFSILPKTTLKFSVTFILSSASSSNSDQSKNLSLGIELIPSRALLTVRKFQSLLKAIEKDDPEAEPYSIPELTFLTNLKP